MNTVAAFGQLNIDIIYAGLDRIPEPGEEVYYPVFDIQLGGGSVLIPIVLGNLGIKGRLGTFLSDDFQSTIARGLLDRLHFKNYRNFYSRKNKSPVIVTSAISMSHDRCFISYCDDRSVTASREDVYSFLHGSRVCFAVPKYPDIMKKLRSEGTIVVYDFGWEDDMHISHYEKILKHVDIYTPNDKEAMKLTGTDTPEKAVRSLAGYVKCPIVKVGKKGCITLIDDNIVHVGMPCPFKAIDTTGAGDNFLAGIVYGLCRNMNIVDSMRMGNIFGGISTTQPGCYKGTMSLTRKKIDELFRKYK